MGIFTKSNGETSNATSYSTGSVFKIIPDGAEVMVNVISVDETQNSTLNKDYDKQGEAYLKIGLVVVEGEYRGVDLSQKIYHLTNDDRIKDRAVDLLAVYNNLSNNNLGKLSARLKSLDELTDVILARAIVGVGALVTVGLIEGSDYTDKKTGEIKKGRDVNFVRDIKPIPQKKIDTEAVVSREPGEDDDFEAIF